MVDYREILRLRSLANNITQIANAVHSSRHTVRDVEKLADEKSIIATGPARPKQQCESNISPEMPWR